MMSSGTCEGSSRSALLQSWSFSILSRQLPSTSVWSQVWPCEEDLDAALLECGAPDLEAFDVEQFAGSWEEDGRKAMQVCNGKVRGEYDVNRLEKAAAESWEVFYVRSGDRFFKDRHYLCKDFPVLGQALEEGNPVTILEVGSGVGNTILPLSRAFVNCKAFGADFSETAIAILNETANKEASPPRCIGVVCDVSRDDALLALQQVPLVDFCTMVFVLSAIAPERMHVAIQNAVAKLRPGGVLLFRDYAEYDEAHIRFPPEQRLGRNYFARQDGTRSFFFSLNGMSFLFERGCGLECVESRLVRRLVLNRASGQRVRRIFACGVYRRPQTAISHAQQTVG